MSSKNSNSQSISVIIPLYNYEKYIGKAIESVRHQTHTNWEIIVVDDKSTDNGVQVVKKYEQKLNGKLKLITNKRNLGVSRSRNIAIQKSRGAFIAFLDADDCWHPKKLEIQMEVFHNTDDTIHLIHTGVKPFANSKTREWLNNGKHNVNSLEHWDKCWNKKINDQVKKNYYFETLLYENPICLSSVMIRREALEFLGGFDNDLYYQVEDWLLWLKCSMLYKIVFIDSKLTFYRIHPQGYTGRVFIRPEYNYYLATCQIRDRLISFMRRKGMEISYEDLKKNFLFSLKHKQLLQRKVKKVIYNIRSFMAIGYMLNKHILPLNRKPKRVYDSDLMILFLTNKCNLSCSACFYRENLNKTKDMDFEQIESIATSSGKVKYTLLTGGEPFLRDDLDKIIELFIQKGNIGINTNGYYPIKIHDILRKVLSKKTHYDLTVSISIDGFEETHNNMRKNPHSYQRALDTLRLLLILRKKYKKLSIIINTLISPNNIDELEVFAYEFAKEFDVNAHNFEFVRLDSNSSDQFQIQQNKIKKTLKKLLEIIFSHYPHTFLTDSNKFKTQYDNIINKKDWKFPCIAGNDAFVIYPSGELSACEMRTKKIHLNDFDYNVMNALSSNTIKNEKEKIVSDKCFCSHGCWLCASMTKYFNQHKWEVEFTKN